MTKRHADRDVESGRLSGKRLEAGLTVLSYWAQLIVLERPRNWAFLKEFLSA